jgi:hypothetical protein
MVTFQRTIQVASSPSDDETSQMVRPVQQQDLAARLREIGEHCASLPDHDTDIVLYDEAGAWA